MWGKQTFKLLSINLNTDLTKMMELNHTPKVRALKICEKSLKKETNRLNRLQLHRFMGEICSLKGILWKQRLRQRTETRVCIFPGPD